MGSGTTFFAKNLVIAGLSSMILVGVKLKEKALPRCAWLRAFFIQSLMQASLQRSE
jgi:hypothetical protein